jgi:outer membrane protein OmpA-like peptidoglycan-associated protein
MADVCSSSEKEKLTMLNKLLIAASILLFLLLCWVCVSSHSSVNTAAVAPAATLAEPTFAAKLADGKVTLDGVLPDAASKTAVLERAKQLYGDGNFIDRLQIAERAKPAWVAALPALLPALKLKDRVNGGISLDGGAINLTGQVATAELKNGIFTEVTKALPAGLKISDLMSVNAGPALSETGLEAQTAVNKELFGKIIEFDTGKATIRPGASGTTILDQVVAVMSQDKYKALAFEVSGHTDNQGNAAANQKLSQARAAAVLKYLTDKGVAAMRLTAVGYGDKKPLMPNDTPDNMQRNRRIEFGVREAKAASPAAGSTGK